jgi:hypothetical protein
MDAEKGRRELAMSKYAWKIRSPASGSPARASRRTDDVRPPAAESLDQADGVPRRLFSGILYVTHLSLYGELVQHSGLPWLRGPGGTGVGESPPASRALLRPASAGDVRPVRLAAHQLDDRPRGTLVGSLDELDASLADAPAEPQIPNRLDSSRQRAAAMCSSSSRGTVGSSREAATRLPV